MKSQGGCFLILFLLSTVEILSQTSTLEYEKINTSNGLSNDNIHKIIQDDRGLIWIASADGLNSYNGFEVKTYKGPKGSDITRDVYNTRLSPDNKIYLFGNDGVNIFDILTQKFSKFEVPEQLVETKQEINDIQFEKDGSMWLLSNQRPNLYFFKDGKTTPYKVFGSNLNQKVKSFKDSNGDLWIYSTYRGVYKLDKKLNKTIFINLRSKGISNRTSSVCEDDKGNIWVAGWPWGIMKITNSINVQDTLIGRIFRGRELTPISHLNDIFINDIEFDPKRNCIYAGHSNGYVVINIDEYNPEFFQIEQYTPDFSDPDGLHSHLIQDIHRDNEGIVWFGSAASGVQMLNYNKKKFVAISPENFVNLRSSRVHSILPFGNGKYILGVLNSAVGVFDPNTNLVTKHTENPELQKIHEGYMNVAFSQIKTQIYDTNSIILGTRYRGVWILSCNDDFNEVTSVIKINRREINGTRTIAQLKENNYLIGCDAGVALLNIADTGFQLSSDDINFQFIRLHEDDGFNTLINKIFVDSKGNCWIAPNKKSLYKITDFKNYKPDKIEYTHYKMDLSSSSTLHSKNIQTIFEDSQGRLWIGGIDAGLMLYNYEEDEFTEFTKDEGWPSNSVFSIEEDNYGMIWVGTNMGLIKFNPSMTLNEGLIKYTTDDGLPGNVFIINSSSKDDDGNLLFGGNKGLSRFNPEKIEENTTVPPIVLTDITVYSKKNKTGSYIINADTLSIKDTKKSIRLRHFEYALRIEFSSLTYTNQYKNRFAFQLEGFDEDWQFRNTSERYAYYSNLKPGKYTFKVKAFNSDGLPNDDAEELLINIRPPWWKTIGFYIVLVILVIAISRTIILNREKRVKRDKEILEQKLKEGEKELKAQKDTLLEQTEELKKRDITESDLKWFNLGMVQVGDAIIKNKNDINTLTRAFLTELISYLDAIQGSIYILNDNDDDEKHLLLESGYGLPAHKLENKRIEIGENLVGACFKANKTMLIDDIPEGYVSISSSLGTSSPKQLLLIPLLSDENPIGVIELSSFNSFTDRQINWLKKIAETYTSNINTLRMNTKFSDLVERMQQQAEEMQAQDEELRQNMEEMQATNEEASRREKELLKINEELIEKEKQLKEKINEKDKTVKRKNRNLGGRK